ncbi:hypothetical protein D3C81_2184430 [compost metagenome]
MVAFLFGGGLEGLSAVIFWLFTGLAFVPEEISPKSEEKLAQPIPGTFGGAP